MTSHALETKSWFVQRHLDPGSRIAEVLFGLIMVLTFTLTAGVTLAEEGHVGMRNLLIATLGCNFAWGLIDGVMYIMDQMFHRGRQARFIKKYKADPDPDHALATISNELDDTLGAVLSQPARERLYRQILNELAHAEPQKTHLRVDDLWGALASFLLVFLSTIPAVVPFLVMSDPWIALRVSNLLLIGMLFLLGMVWARYTNTSRWGAGLALVMLGLLLVAIAIALGG